VTLDEALGRVPTGDIVARMITVRGTVDGTMMATGRVDVMNEAKVTGRVLAPHFMLADGGTFTGKVEPQHLDAALKAAFFVVSLQLGSVSHSSMQMPGHQIVCTIPPHHDCW